MQFAPQTFGRSNAPTCATVKEHTLQLIQKTCTNGHDVATALGSGADVDFDLTKPVRKVSQQKQPEDKKFEQDGLDIEFQEEFKRHMDRKDDHRKNVLKACALILSHCTKTMKARPEEHPNFTNPIQKRDSIGDQW